MFKTIQAGAFAVALFAAGPALAERFVSAYAPQAGERAEITIDKCRVSVRNGERSESCARSVLLEEVLSPSAQGGGRMRYTLQSVQPLGASAAAAAGALTPDVERALRNFSLLVVVDEAGFPTRVENFDEMMRHVRAFFPADDAGAQRALDAFFERMDAAGAAQLFTRDWAGVSLFQAIEAEVGEPVTGTVTMPFPVDPSLTIDATATLLVQSIDHASRRARITYTQVVDEASARPVVQVFVERMMAAASAPPADMAEQLAAMRISRTDRWDAVVDVPSGRVVEMRSEADAAVAVGDDTRRTTDTITLTRRMLPPQ